MKRKNYRLAVLDDAAEQAAFETELRERRAQWEARQLEALEEPEEYPEGETLSRNPYK